MLRSIAVITLLVFSAPVFADGPNWNFIEGRYQRVNLDDGLVDETADGFGIGGSFEIGSSWHAFASYSQASFDFDVDLDEVVIGGGFHTAITDNADFVANIGYTRVEASAAQAISIDDDGFIAQIGVRGMVTDRVELAGYLTQVELSDSGGDTSLSAEGWYSFTDAFALGLTLGGQEDVFRYGIGARLYFGN